jgi:hypothetical protein
MDRPELAPGETWKVPCLETKDIGPGHFIGVSELTGTEGTGLIGGKARSVLSWLDGGERKRVTAK